jgi:hypothetical protein
LVSILQEELLQARQQLTLQDQQLAASQQQFLAAEQAAAAACMLYACQQDQQGDPGMLQPQQQQQQQQPVLLEQQPLADAVAQAADLNQQLAACREQLAVQERDHCLEIMMLQQEVSAAQAAASITTRLAAAGRPPRPHHDSHKADQQGRQQQLQQSSWVSDSISDGTVGDGVGWGEGAAGSNIYLSEQANSCSGGGAGAGAAIGNNRDATLDLCVEGGVLDDESSAAWPSQQPDPLGDEEAVSREAGRRQGSGTGAVWLGNDEQQQQLHLQQVQQQLQQLQRQHVELYGAATQLSATSQTAIGGATPAARLPAAELGLAKVAGGSFGVNLTSLFIENAQQVLNPLQGSSGGSTPLELLKAGAVAESSVKVAAARRSIESLLCSSSNSSGNSGSGKGSIQEGVIQSPGSLALPCQLRHAVSIESEPTLEQLEAAGEGSSADDRSTIWRAQNAQQAVQAAATTAAEDVQHQQLVNSVNNRSRPDNIVDLASSVDTEEVLAAAAAAMAAAGRPLLEQ